MTWHPDMPLEYQNQIVTGDARELAKRIPNESVDLIFTDPVYDQIDDYRWLAETAVRVLKPNSACLAWCSKVKLSEGACYNAMLAGGLTYQTTLFYTVIAKTVRPAFHIGIMSWTTPCLVFAKGIYKCDPFLVDTWIDTDGPQSRFNWQKNTPVSIKWLEAFNRERGIVWDPFTGSGSFLAACIALDMPFIASEINPVTAELARARATQQPPLPRFNELIQAGMFGG
jgi:hypothetical protein